MRLMQLVVGLMLTLVCAGILAGCGTNTTSTSTEQIQLSLRFTDGAGNAVALSEGTTKLTPGMTLKAIAIWSPQEIVPIQVTIKVTEIENTPGDLSISNDVKGIMPTLSTQIKSGKTYKVTASGQQGSFKWNAGEYVFVCNPQPAGDPTLSMVTVFDTTVGDMAQILPDQTNHFSVPAGHSFRLGASTTWYHPRTTWDCPGERNALAKTANGFYAAANGEGIIVVTITNLDTGETVDHTITITVIGAPDGDGMGFSR